MKLFKILAIPAVLGLAWLATPSPEASAQIGYRVATGAIAWPISVSTQIFSASNSTVDLNDPPDASSGGEVFDFATTLTIMNGSDITNVLFVDVVNADHTGSGNAVYGVSIDQITGDAQATENAINIGDGWDNELFFAGGAAVIKYANTGLLDLVDAGGVSLVRLKDVPAAGTGTDLFELNYIIGAMNGSDTMRGFFVDFTNAAHSGSGNTLHGIDVDDITGDSDAYEAALRLGGGWDTHIQFTEIGASPPDNPPSGTVALFVDDNADYSGGGGNDCIMGIIDSGGNIDIVVTIVANGACP